MVLKNTYARPMDALTKELIVELETKKNIRLISSNSDAKGNKVEAFEEERNPQTELGKHHKDLMERAGKLHLPNDRADYLGSAVVHFYKQDILGNRQNLFVVCQTSLENVADEQHCSLGHKQLGEVMMKRFGRKPPKTTK